MFTAHWQFPRIQVLRVLAMTMTLTTGTPGRASGCDRLRLISRMSE
jgi:hypothetical protein